VTAVLQFVVFWNITQCRVIRGGWLSVVGIATRYELGGPGIESRWRQDFPRPSRAALGPTQPPVQRYRVFLGGKTVETWR